MRHLFWVVVTFNGAKWIQACLASIQAQDCPGDVIVVDNSSTDGTPDLVGEEFPEVRLIQTGENLGFGKANNIGILEALKSGADYVFLLNQDAYLHQGSLTSMLRALDEETSAGIVSPLQLAGDRHNLDFSFHMDMRPSLTPDLVGELILGSTSRELYESEFASAAAWLVKSSVFLKVGLFDPCFQHYGEDDEFVFRVKSAGLRVFVHPNLAIVHDRAQDRSGNAYFRGSKHRVRRLHLKLKTEQITQDEFRKRKMRLFAHHAIRFNVKTVLELMREFALYESDVGGHIWEPAAIKSALTAAKGPPEAG